MLIHTHIDLFSGIGGFALAAQASGLETVLFCEKEPFAQRILKKHWPEVPIVDDIRELRNVADTGGIRTSVRGIGREIHNKQRNGEAKKRGRHELESRAISHSQPFLLTGGFPCQPFSAAGKRKGTEDDRYLWPEMVRVIEEFKPTWVIGENVAGLLSMDDGDLIDQILADLEGIGYECCPLVIPACGVGATHRRDRVWIVGNAYQQGLEGQWVRRDGHQTKTQGQEVFNWRGRNPKGNGTQSRLGRNTDGLPDWMDRPRWPMPIGNDQHDWEPPRTTKRKEYRADRLKGLGNAIVPQVAYPINKVNHH